MLQAIRDRVTGIIAWVIVGLISVTFALWGVDSYLGGSASNYAAKVNDTEISTDQYRLGLRQQANRMQAMLGERFDRSMLTTTEFKRAVLNRLVEEELLLQAADDYGLSISDSYLAARIHADSAFQTDGEFDPERYRNLLAQQGMSPSLYEHQLRRSLLINQLISSISTSGIVTEAAVSQGLQLQNQGREIAFLQLPLDPWLERVEVSEDEIAAYYEANSGQFVEPQQVQLKYLELSLDDLRQEISIDEARLRQLYEDEKARLAGEEQRRARHILIELSEGAGAAEEAAARERARAIHQQLQDGADFAELAEAESDDPGSAAQGGDLGFFSRGFMVPEFEQTAFSLEPGRISEPVRSPFGFHIIEVTDIRAKDVPGFEEMRDELHRRATQDEAEQRFYDIADRLSQLTFEIPDSLQPAADELDLEIQTSDWISESGGPGIGQYDQVLNAAFSEDVLDQRNNSQPLEVEPNHVLVLRVAEHQPTRPLPLEAVSDRIRERVAREKAAGQLREHGQALLARLEAGETTLEALAEEASDASLETPGAIKRGDPGVDPVIAARAFKLPRHSDGSVTRDAFVDSRGDYILLELRGVQEPDLQAVGENQRQAFRRNLLQLYGSVEAQALVEQLRAGAEIEINEQLIED
ncbi:SurA N-terminal domain-containing protein [Thiohalobacter thiocyanaticus]|uniref:Periplasmic chaperone PpiD n=1 Tax=Thiohalobacter thiocyanaticus TaxID=585455 RepID=A0A426QGF3_9GAMM|nr:SurA N-terminal domain-containing protein [Thiohalobacter thiocyanaticus]RRQ20826.1 peptidylprolyl isomerase [Thiohalobacter thiocyanaticus]